MRHIAGFGDLLLSPKYPTQSEPCAGKFFHEIYVEGLIELTKGGSG